MNAPLTRRRFARRAGALATGMACLAACLALFTGKAAAQAPACAPPTCVELRKFVVSVADFQTSKQGYNRLVTATVRFRNTSAKPLILGYLRDSGVATDDRGNRYVLYGPVRGIGEITSREFDPKFVLEPGESSEARFEFVWRPNAQDIYGTAYDLDLAVREIDPVTASQYRLGLEHALRFKRLTTETVAGTTAGTPAAAPAQTTASPAPTTAVPTSTPDAAPVPAAAAPDPCGATPRCFDAGPFTADVVQVTPSKVSRHHVLQVHVRFRNVSAQPIILAYSARTSGAIDNYGNRYHWGRAGTYDTSVKGMGIVQARKADPQFVLQPGQSRNATFDVIRYDVGTTAIGTSFTYDVAVEQLQVLPSQQVQSVRQYSLNFPSVTAGGPAPTVNDAVKALKDVFKKK